MFKKISVKFAFCIIICIACLTFIFIPLYFQYQRNIFIGYERSRMLSFADALIEYMEDPSYSVHNLSDYIEENEGEEYEIHLRDQETNLLFSSRRKLHGDMEAQDSGSSIPVFQPEKYSGDGEPKEDKVKKNITLRKKYSFKDGSYYLFCREKLESMDALFSYTNKMSIIILIIYVIACVMTIYIVTDHIIQPVRELSDVTDKIAHKDYSVRYKGRISEDEIGVLARNVNHMANTISDNVNSLENFNYLLRERVTDMNQLEETRKKAMAVISHELKTPLAVISSQIEMMDLLEDKEKKHRYYLYCMDEINKMSDMLSSLLSDMASGEELFNEELERLCVGGVIENLCEKRRTYVESYGINFESHIYNYSEKNTYRKHVEYVFNNYLTNAIRHTSPGGTIRVMVLKAKNACRLSVYNDGNRIPEEDKDRIWIDYFTSMDADKGKGFGLGLFIVKEIAHQGHSKCGYVNHEQGVEFWFDFINQ